MGYNIRWENDGVFVEMDGQVNSIEIGHVNNRLYADERYDNIHFRVLDMSRAEVKLSKAEVIEIGSLDSAASRWNNKIRMAFLTENSDLRELIEIHYKKHMADTNWQIDTFSNKSEVMDWLKV